MKTTHLPRSARRRAVCPASVASVSPGHASAGDMVLGRRRRTALSLSDMDARLRESSDEDAAKDDAIDPDSALRFRRPSSRVRR